MRQSSKRRSFDSRPKIAKKKWLLSYIFVLIIPLVCFIFILFYTRNVITRETVDTNLLLNKAIQISIDNRIRQSMETATIIFYDDRFREIIRKDNSYLDIVYLQRNFIDLLGNYKKVIDGIDILVYVDELDYIFTTSTANFVSRLSGALNFLGFANASEDEWKYLLASSGQNNDFLSLPYLSYNNYGQESLTFCMNTNQMNLRNCYFTNIYVTMRYTDLVKAFEGKKDSIILILDSQGKPVHSFGKEIPNLVINIDSPLNSGNYSLIYYQGTNYVYTLSKSETSPFYYAVMTKEAYFWDWGSALERVILLAMAAALVVGLVISVSMLQVNYRPVESVINTLDKMEKEHIRQDQFLRENILITALSRNMKFFTNDELVESIGLGYRDFSLVPISVSSLNMELSALIAETNTNTKLNLSMVLNGQLRLLAGNGYHFHNAAVDDAAVFIFLVEPEKLDIFYQDIQPLLIDLCNVFHDKYSVSLDIVIGNEAKSFDLLFPRYQEIKMMRMTGTIKGKYRVIRTPLVNFSLGSGIFPSINSYIKKHYDNKNLSLTTIADAMGLTVKYISKRFKYETGQGLLNFINSVRIQKAKDFLKDGQYTLKQVSEMAGYSNIKTFRRVFMKIEGLDPREYHSP